MPERFAIQEHGRFTQKPWNLFGDACARPDTNISTAKLRASHLAVATACGSLYFQRNTQSTEGQNNNEAVCRYHQSGLPSLGVSGRKWTCLLVSSLFILEALFRSFSGTWKGRMPHFVIGQRDEREWAIA